MKETLKTLTIILLAAVMIGLSWLSLTMGLAQSSPFGLSMTQVSQGAPPEDAEKNLPMMNLPRKIAVLGDHGVYSPWTPEEYYILLLDFSNIFDEATGSAGAPETIDITEFKADIATGAVVLNYDCAVYGRYFRLCSFARDMEEDFYVKSIAITEKDNRVYILTETDIGYFRCETAVNSASLYNACNSAEYYDNAYIAFQNDALSHLPPGNISYKTSGYLPVYNIHSVYDGQSEDIVRDILNIGNVNPSLAQSYRDSRDYLVFVEGDTIVTAEDNGEIVFMFSDTDNFAKSNDIYSMLEQAYALVSAMWIKAGAGGELSLAKINTDGDVIEVGFEMIIGGMPVFTEMMPAYVRLTNGEITGISITPMTADNMDYVSHVPWTMQVTGISDKPITPAIGYRAERESLYFPKIYSGS